MSLSGMVKIPRLQAKKVYVPSPLRGEGQGEGRGADTAPSFEVSPSPLALSRSRGRGRESVGFKRTTPKVTGLKPVVVYLV